MDIQKITTNNFKIEKNIITFTDSMIQISNISQVSISPVPKKRFNLWSIVLMACGLFLAQTYGELEYLGLGILGVGVGYIIFYFYEYYDGVNDKYLNIYLNSGKVYSMICRNTNFMTQVMEVMEYCINNHSAQIVQIDFQNCKMFNSPIIVGDENEVR